MEFISPEILNYCESHTNPESELLQQLNRDTYAKVLNPRRMLSGHLQQHFGHDESDASTKKHFRNWNLHGVLCTLFM